MKYVVCAMCVVYSIEWNTGAVLTRIKYKYKFMKFFFASNCKEDPLIHKRMKNKMQKKMKSFRSEWILLFFWQDADESEERVLEMYDDLNEIVISKERSVIESIE